jgi:hypothetical protein
MDFMGLYGNLPFLLVFEAEFIALPNNFVIFLQIWLESHKTRVFCQRLVRLKRTYYSVDEKIISRLKIGYFGLMGCVIKLLTEIINSETIVSWIVVSCRIFEYFATKTRIQ